MAEIFPIPKGLFESICYEIHLSETTLVIDPSVNPVLHQANLPPVSLIMATHGHIDHICQADAWRQTTGAPLAIHPADGDCLSDADRNLSGLLFRPMIFRQADQYLSDLQVIRLDLSHHLEILHTPGHTSGSICLLLYQSCRPICLFSGDTLFAGSIGRLDFGGDPAAMKQSLDRLSQLGRLMEYADIPVYPGHGPATTLRQELDCNPYLREFL